MVFYFTATGNSLYVAKHLDDELYSIPQEMEKQERSYKAETIGIVCPLFEFEIPNLVKDFIAGSEFDADYLYVVVTYGMHHGGVAPRTQAFLASVGKEADYINTIIMHDNAIIVFDMDEQRRLEAGKHVDKHIAAVKLDIDARKQMIQEPSQEETDFYEGYRKMIAEKGPMYTFPLYQVTEACVGCGTCARVCPRGCIRLENARPTYDYAHCVNCMACIQACPTKALQFATIEEPNPNARYRNPNIKLSELIEANCQL